MKLSVGIHLQYINKYEVICRHTFAVYLEVELSATAVHCKTLINDKIPCDP